MLAKKKGMVMFKEYEVKTKFLTEWSDVLDHTYSKLYDRFNEVYSTLKIKEICFHDCYLALKSRVWLKTDCFTELWQRHFEYEHSIDSQVSIEILEIITQVMCDHARNDQLTKNQILFELSMDYVFTDHCDQFTLRNGFGYNLWSEFVFLEEQLESTLQIPAEQSSLSYELSQALQKALYFKEQTPLAHSIYRLNTIMKSHDLLPSFDLATLERLLAVLGAIGHDGLTQKQVKELNIDSDLKILIDSKLIFTSKNRAHITLQLSQKGASIAADMLVRSAKLDSIELVKGQSDLIQTAFIEQYSGTPADLARQTIPILDSIGPRAAGALIKRLSQEKPGSILDILQVLPYEKCSSWAKYEICRNLRFIPLQVDIRQIVKRLVASEPSKRVSHCASKTLSLRQSDLNVLDE